MVAIIAILAAIAVPNFLEAQVRSKVARVKADLRSVATAIEAYAIDWNYYPIGAKNRNRGTRGALVDMPGLSTPIAYMTSTDIRDPFNKYRGYAYNNPKRPMLSYINVAYYRQQYSSRNDVSPTLSAPAWMTLSWGPDYVKGPNANGGNWGLGPYGRNPPAATPPEAINDHRFGLWNYDPTNGTISNGDIMRWH